jgi:ribosomal protein L11 methyltransferase
VAAAFPEAVLSEVADGWEERWREFHRAIEVGPLWVGPPWQTGSAPAAATTVVIDPGRAFGTGAHATTRLCLELLSREARGGLLDLGCGSGVLAIAAAALGFAPVVALDNDPVALAVAAENARVNGVELELVAADVRRDRLPAAGLAVANIALDAVAGLSGRLEARKLIASGYRANDTAPRLAGFAVLERRELDGWAADLYTAR